MSSPDPATQLAILMEGVETVRPEHELGDRLASGRPLRVKLGLDPTVGQVTLGWAVVLHKLRQFQELGHTAVLIVGDFTARVGDPSGKSETRRRLSAEEVRSYAEAVLAQLRRVLAPSPLEIRHNSEWLESLGMTEILELTSTTTVAQMLERSDFATRYRDGVPISVMEMLYPLLQGYDSVAVEADVELGGSDQLWNLLVGRTVQQRFGLAPQVAITMPLLIGTDGEQKMSQSIGNYIGVDDPPEEMFGKAMSIPDHLIGQWLRLAARLPEAEAAALTRPMEDGTVNPALVKRELARRIVALYWDGEAAARAEQAFDLIHRHHGVPEDVPQHRLPDQPSISLPALLRAAGVVGSSGEARRLIGQGAVRIDGRPAAAPEVPRADLVGRVIQVGKRRFLRLVD